MTEFKPARKETLLKSHSGAFSISESSDNASSIDSDLGLDNEAMPGYQNDTRKSSEEKRVGRASEKIREDKNECEIVELPDLGERYKIIEKLGSSQNTSDWKVYDCNAKLFLTIRVFDLPDVHQREAVDKQGEKLINLTHPNIVSLLDKGNDSRGNQYFVWEFCEGETLSTILQNSEKLTQEQCIDIFEQLWQGLAYVHLNGLVHGCITPREIIVSTAPGGLKLVKISNLGQSEVHKELNRAMIENETASNSLLYALSYSSPEVCVGQTATEESDIYSLGCILYEMLSGSPPFKSNERLELIGSHLVQELSLEQIDPKFHMLLKCCLQKKASERTADFNRLIEKIQLSDYILLESASGFEMMSVVGGMLAIVWASAVTFKAPGFWFLVPGILMWLCFALHIGLVRRSLFNAELRYLSRILFIASVVSLGASIFSISFNNLYPCATISLCLSLFVLVANDRTLGTLLSSALSKTSVILGQVIWSSQEVKKVEAQALYWITGLVFMIPGTGLCLKMMGRTLTGPEQLVLGSADYQLSVFIVGVTLLFLLKVTIDGFEERKQVIRQLAWSLLVAFGALFSTIVLLGFVLWCTGRFGS